mgnify:FL=1
MSAPPAFLAGVREICDKHGILYIADEVQAGFGRTGKMFAVEHAGVRPDIMVMAKGLANGFPLSAVVGSAEVMNSMPPGSMVRTRIHCTNLFRVARTRATPWRARQPRQSSAYSAKSACSTTSRPGTCQ